MSKQIDVDLQTRLTRLEDHIGNLNKVIIALSGGVDSSLMAYIARRTLGEYNALAIIADSPSLKRRDLEEAVDHCKANDICYEIIELNEMNDENYLANPNDRCYFCKSALYEKIQHRIDTDYQGFVTINGNNYSDLGDYRPGLQAGKEKQAVSPFIEACITKADIRLLAKHFGLNLWDKPASPCLSSRFPYGERISLSKLQRVEMAETVLNNYGFNIVRVRSDGDTARIEVPREDIPALRIKLQAVEEAVINTGFSVCEIDPEGFVSGKLNRILQ